MKVRIVKASDIAACPRHILSLNHWIPVHDITVCNRDADKMVRAFDRAAAAEHKTAIAELCKQRAIKREVFVALLGMHFQSKEK